MQHLDGHIRCSDNNDIVAVLYLSFGRHLLELKLERLLHIHCDFTVVALVILFSPMCLLLTEST